jgi:hypothetical protein
MVRIMETEHFQCSCQSYKEHISQLSRDKTRLNYLWELTNRARTWESKHDNFHGHHPGTVSTVNVSRVSVSEKGIDENPHLGDR